MNTEFRIYYGTDLASQERLDAIEEVVVEQEVGKAWEARIRIPVCIREDGSWQGENDGEYAENARVRIEVRLDDGEFVPLFEGRFQAQHPDYNAAPGLSTITLVARDDTSLLHRRVESRSFSGQTDAEIVQAIFDEADLGEPPEIDVLPDRPDMDAVLNQLGSMMQMLRSIAARYGEFHAYVLPGETVGASKGCFKAFAQLVDPALPVMYLSGPNRNITGFQIERNAARASRVEAAHLSFGDLSVTTAHAGPGDAVAPGASSASSVDDAEIRLRRLPASIAGLTDLDAAVSGMASMSGYTLRAEGSVNPAAYRGILSPYRKVAVRVSDSRYSTDYVIYKVVHTLGISEYTQSFNVIGNAASADDGSAASAPHAAAEASVEFNVQMGIF